MINFFEPERPGITPQTLDCTAKATKHIGLLEERLTEFVQDCLHRLPPEQHRLSLDTLQKSVREPLAALSEALSRYDAEAAGHHKNAFCRGMASYFGVNGATVVPERLPEIKAMAPFYRQWHEKMQFSRLQVERQVTLLERALMPDIATAPVPTP